MADETPAPDAKPANGAQVTNDWIYKLRKPLMAHGDEIAELKFREPTGADIEACGSPIIFNLYAAEGEPKTRVEPRVMFSMMSRLASVPPSTIRSMNAREWEYVANVLMHRFFMWEP